MSSMHPRFSVQQLMDLEIKSVKPRGKLCKMFVEDAKNVEGVSVPDTILK